MVALNPIVKWFDLGLHLGLSHATLETIEIERRERVEECKREMLVAWLQSATNTTKQELMSALSKISQCITFSQDSEYQETQKDITQEIMQPVHDRQVHSDQEVQPADHSRELQQSRKYRIIINLKQNFVFTIIAIDLPKTYVAIEASYLDIAPSKNQNKNMYRLNKNVFEGFEVLRYVERLCLKC